MKKIYLLVVFFAFINMQAFSQTDSLPKIDTVPVTKNYKHTVPNNPNGDSPYFFVKSDNPETDKFPLRATYVDVNIAGVIADIVVKQVYINESPNTLEAIYIFPSSTNAAVYGMNMIIGNRILIAKIEEKKQARIQYEEAKQQGKTATLLEQNRPNVFQMNVANILPGDTITVELKYTELLVPKFGVYEFMYPSVVAPRYSETNEDWVQKAKKQAETGLNIDFDINVNINAGMPIQKVESTFHKVKTDLSKQNFANIRLDESEKKLSKSDYILKYSLRGNEVQSGLLLYEHGDENFFLLMMQPPESPKLEQIPPREYIFIVDVSGSMSGFPLDVSKTMLRQLISSLRPTDKFNVQLFETSSKFWHQESVNASKENIDKAINYITSTRGGGGTRLGQALDVAFDMKKTADYSRNFIILTDGNISVEKEAFQLIKDKKGEANLFAVGIGGYLNRYCIEGMAYSSMTEPYFISNQQEADSVGKNFLNFIDKPVLTNIETKFDNFDVYDMEPVSIPDVFAERPIIVFGKYKGNPTGNITISGLSGNKPYSQTFDVSKANKDNNQAIRYLWARSRIKYLSDYANYYESGNSYYSQKTAPTAENITKITNLGLKYNLLTEYTSFIAIDSLIRKPKENEEVKLNDCDTLDMNIMGLDQSIVMNNNQNNVNNKNPIAMGISRNTSETKYTPTVNNLNNEQISEVVVTGLGIKRDEKAIAYSVTSVEESNISINRDGVNALQGKVAGVNITSASGAPGSSTNVTIRGNGSVTGNSQPLYVIDGVPFDPNSSGTSGINGGTDFGNGSSDVNAQDVETISVIKGSEATALYGSRAANGVIIITTKEENSRHRALKIEINSYAEMYQANKLPELQTTYAQGSGGIHLLTNNFDSYSWGAKISEISANAYDNYDFFKNGLVFQNNARISYKKRKSSTYLSATNITENGIVPNSSLQTNNIKFGFDYDADKRFSFQTSANLSNTQGNRISNGADVSSIMFGLLTTPPSFDNSNDLQTSYNGGLTDNPYWQIDNNIFNTNQNNLKGFIQPSYEIGNFDFTNKTSLHINQNQTDIGFDINSAINPLGQYSQHFEDFMEISSTSFVSYFKEFYDFSFDIMSGYQYEYSDRNINSYDGKIFEQQGIFEMENNMLVSSFKNNFKRETHNIFSVVKLSYRNFLFLNLSASEIITSTLPKANNKLFSPSSSASFVFTDAFSSLRSFMDYGKIRIAYAQVKKEAPIFISPEYFLMQSFSINSPQYYMHRRNVIFDDNLIAEQKNDFEIGTDLRFFRGDLTFDVTYFNATTKNQIIPTQQGADVKLTNGGTINSEGFEIDFGIVFMKSRNFKWETNTTWSNAKTIVTQLDAPNEVVYLTGLLNVGSVVMEGEEYGAIYGSKYKRDANNNMIIGANGFPLVDENYGIIGNPNPDWIMGLENAFTFYRNWKFSFLFDIKKGGDMWNGTKNTLNYYGVSQESADLRETTNYIFEGVKEDGTTNDIPVDFVSSDNDLDGNYWQMYGIAGVAEDAIEDASWIRLRTVSLTYNMPKYWFRHNFIDQVSISAYANNLYLYTPYTGVDPETNFTGASNGFGLYYFNMPNHKSFGGKLSVKF